MKKILFSLTLILILSLSSISLASGLTDIHSHWAKDNIENLVNKGAITGYPDGTFKPNDNVSRAEAIKILLISKIGEDLGSSKDGFWADNYINDAKSRGYILEGEFEAYGAPMTREEFARLVVRALDEEYPDNLIEYSKQIKDYSNTDNEFKDYVLKAYVKGIVTGYKDGTFKPNDNVTRAEAATMLIRFLELDKRVIPEIAVEKPKSDFIEPEFVVEYTPHYRSYEGYFTLNLKNRNEYKESNDQYEIKIMCVNHKELNKSYSQKIFSDMSWYVNDTTTWKKAELMTWALPKSFYIKPNEKYEVSADIEVELEITLRNATKGTEKKYKKIVKATE